MLPTQNTQKFKTSLLLYPDAAVSVNGNFDWNFLPDYPKQKKSSVFIPFSGSQKSILEIFSSNVAGPIPVDPRLGSLPVLVPSGNMVQSSILFKSGSGLFKVKGNARIPALVFQGEYPGISAEAGLLS